MENVLMCIDKLYGLGVKFQLWESEVKIVLEVMFNWCYLNPKEELIILQCQLCAWDRALALYWNTWYKKFICIQNLFLSSEGINIFLNRRKGEAIRFKEF